MITVQVAKQIIQDAVGTGSSRKMPLLEAFGLILSEDIVATVDIPNFAQSSMDGYAFKFSGHARTFEVIGEMQAGATTSLKVEEGEATRIFTGAPLPEGADTVVMQEKVILEDNTILLQDPALVRELNVRLKGAEVKKGSVAMEKGMYLSAAAIGFLAGIGCTHATVYETPKVAIVLTGNELREPGESLEFGQVYEANSFMLTAALRKAGVADVSIFRSEDDLDKLTSIFKETLRKHDVVLLSGGVSVGDYDFVVASAMACGVQQRFHKIKQKPGKPFFFGTLADKLVFGLPGNPSSGLTCFYEYVLPALEKLMHQPHSMVSKLATVTHDYSKPIGLTHFLKAWLKDGKVTPLHAQDSFRLHSFAQANCLIVLPEESEGCISGDAVEIHSIPL